MDTVKELIEYLKTFPDNTPIRLWDYGWDVDIPVNNVEEVWENGELKGVIIKG